MCGAIASAVGWFIAVAIVSVVGWKAGWLLDVAVVTEYFIHGVSSYITVCRQTLEQTVETLG